MSLSVPPSTANLAPVSQPHNGTTTSGRKKRTPKDYALAVSKHSTLTKESSLHPGITYRPLALFLNGRTTYTAHNARRSGFRNHTFAALHDLSCDHDDPKRVTNFDSAKGLTAFADHPLPQNDAGQLLFLRGFPTHRWLNLIGARYQIDPEVFRRQLNFHHTQEFFDLPPLPSSSSNILRLSLTNIGKRHGATLDRGQGEHALITHFRELGSDANIVGESLVRRFSVYDEQHFSIEQDITMSVVKAGQGWLGLIILDNGRDLNEGPDGPWSKPNYKHSNSDSIFYPTIQFQSKISLKEQEKIRIDGNDHSNGLSTNSRRFMQSASLLASNHYGRFLSSSLMRVDPFYAMHDLFAFRACAENQFLNLLKTKLDAEAQRQDDEHYIQQSLQNLRHHKALLHDHIEQLQDTLACIQRRGSPQWQRISGPHKPFLRRVSTNKTIETPETSRKLSIPMSITSIDENSAQEGASATESQAQRIAQADAAAESLVQDYETLLERSKALSQLYSESIDDIRTSAMLLESKKAIAQAEGVVRLSFLAILFLPLSFTTSLFGMPFKELGDVWSIWVWIVTTIPVFGFTLLLCFWGDVSRAVRNWFR